MRRLVDIYGFSFAEAEEIASSENADTIMSYIIDAYEAGKKSITRTWV
jgi:hypothetical protein